MFPKRELLCGVIVRHCSLDTLFSLYRLVNLLLQTMFSENNYFPACCKCVHGLWWHVVNQAGLFFLKHAEEVEKDLPARELLELLLLSLQWLSGMITLSIP